ncbi:putative transporter [Rhypophila decipiens]|uniref:Transporter n=1 Tax=Rhypophila decipiens TaxID=261697 RepID=A0AAN6YHV5_9PEZI|nr:putative transporter [Rhypophila decipiens]
MLPRTRATGATTAAAAAGAGLITDDSPASQANNIKPVKAPTTDEAPAVELPRTSISPPVIALDTGLKPWKVVTGSFCIILPTYGLLSSIGLFQTYWKSHVLGSSFTESEISWIISMFGFLVCFFAAPSGILFDRYGHEWLLGISTAVYVGAFFGLSFCSTYGQFMVCLVVAGVSAAPPATVAFAVVSQWFKVKEGIATGCVTLGAAVGGILFSMVLQILFDKLPWKWAIIALSGIILGFMTLGNVLVETNMSLHGGRRDHSPPSSNHEEEKPNEELIISVMLKSMRFWFVSISIFAYELVLFIQWGSIPTYAAHTDFADKQFYLMMSYNIGAILGRTLPPWLSDRFLGPLNTIILMNMFTLLVVLGVWLPFGASTVQGLFVAIVLMGIGTGSFVPLGVSCVSAMCEPRDTGTWLGSVYTIVSFATLIGNPATGAILAAYGSTGLLVFLAIALLVGLMSITALRWVSQGKRMLLRDKI